MLIAVYCTLPEKKFKIYRIISLLQYETNLSRLGWACQVRDAMA